MSDSESWFSYSSGVLVMSLVAFITSGYHGVYNLTLLFGIAGVVWSGALIGKGSSE